MNKTNQHGSIGTINIIVPVYNAKKFIRKMIRSIRKQTYTDWHLIMVNDGSTDGSGDILNQYAEQDPRITVIHQHNQGSQNARSTGILSEAAQKNQWTVFVDADDILPRYALEKLAAPVADHPDVELVCGVMGKLIRGFVIDIGYKGSCFNITKPDFYDRKRIYRELMTSFYGCSNLSVGLWAKLIRTDVLTTAYRNKPSIRFFGDDISITIQIVSSIERCVLIPDVVYGYRPGGGTSRFMPGMIEDCLTMYDFKKEIAAGKPLPDEYKMLMSAEMQNNLAVWIGSCKYTAKWDDAQIIQEVERLRALPQIKESAAYVYENNGRSAEYAGKLLYGTPEEIMAEIDARWNQWHPKGFKTIIKKILIGS